MMKNEIPADLQARKGNFVVTLTSVGNPDYRQDPTRALPGVKDANVNVDTIAAAVLACQTFIAENDLGSGNWSGGEVLEDGVLVAQISYNGRVWQPLDVWNVLYSESCLRFQCQAETITHAIEQCQNAYPGEPIVSASLDALRSVDVTCWDSQHYGNDEPFNGTDFLMELDDQRISNGQLCIDIAAKDGAVDDVMTLSLEVGRLPGSQSNTQVAHLSFDGDNMAATIFKQSDTYIIRPEVGVTLRETKLPGGEVAFILG